MVVTIPIRPSDELKKPVIFSAIAHIGVVAALLFSPPPQPGDAWGGTGGSAIQVGLVGNVPGIPLPPPAVETDNLVATDSPGIFQPETQSDTSQTDTQRDAADAAPAFEESRRDSIPAPPESSGNTRTVNPPGAVSSGGGGPVAIRRSTFRARAGTGGSSFGAGGSFGGKYAWYVEGVQRRISSNWLISAVDPYVQRAPRVIVTFDILRDGSITNIQVIKSSGVVSVDRSSVRAIRESSRLPSLPSDYTGRRVSVEFFFDFRRP